MHVPNTCAHARTHPGTQACMHECTLARVHVRMYACLLVHMFTGMCLEQYVTAAHAYAHAYNILIVIHMMRMIKPCIMGIRKWSGCMRVCLQRLWVSVRVLP